MYLYFNGNLLISNNNIILELINAYVYLLIIKKSLFTFNYIINIDINITSLNLFHSI